jgi:hypothetical protein
MSPGRFTLLLVTLLLPGCSGRKPLPHEGKNAEELMRMIDSEVTASQVQGALGLALLGADASEAVPRLTELLASKEGTVRQNAALALGKIGPEAKAAVPALTRCLTDADWPIRRHAAIALGEIGPPARAENSNAILTPLCGRQRGMRLERSLQLSEVELFNPLHPLARLVGSRLSWYAGWRD